MNTKTKKEKAPKLLTNGGHGGPARDEIAQAAYYLWERKGRPQDQDVQLWLQAETQLRQSQTQNGVQG